MSTNSSSLSETMHPRHKKDIDKSHKRRKDSKDRN